MKIGAGVWSWWFLTWFSSVCKNKKGRLQLINFTEWYVEVKIGRLMKNWRSYYDSTDYFNKKSFLVIIGTLQK